jgi:hypothetical protein
MYFFLKKKHWIIPLLRKERIDAVIFAIIHSSLIFRLLTVKHYRTWRKEKEGFQWNPSPVKFKRLYLGPSALPAERSFFRA